MVFLRISGKAPRHDGSRGGQIIPSSLKVAKPYHLNIHLSRVTTIYGMHTISTSLEGENHTNLTSLEEVNHPTYTSLEGQYHLSRCSHLNKLTKLGDVIASHLKLSPTDPLTDSR